METNRHHTFWQRRSYKTPLERAFRNHQGLVIPTPIDQHRDLHAHLLPPPKPSRDLMVGIINNLERPIRGRLDGLLFTLDYLDTQSQAENLSAHLTKQLGYLVIGAGNEIPEAYYSTNS